MGSWGFRSRVKRCRRGPLGLLNYAQQRRFLRAVRLFAMRPALTAKVGWSRVKVGGGGSMCFTSLANRRGKCLSPWVGQEEFRATCIAAEHYPPPRARDRSWIAAHDGYLCVAQDYPPP